MTNKQDIPDKPGPELDAELGKLLEIKPRVKWCVGKENAHAASFEYRLDAEKYLNEYVERFPKYFKDYSIHKLEIYPQLSQSWEGMRLVVEEMKRRGYWLMITFSAAYVCVEFGKYGSDKKWNVEVPGDSAPHAVSIAAIKAIRGNQYT